MQATKVHTVRDKRIVPTTLDWREKGIVAPIKNQEECGCCYAFSAISALESRNAQKTGKLVKLSEQNMVDCSGSSGCNGGWPNASFQYIIDNEGVNTEEAYPYKAKRGDCKFNPSAVGATVKEYVKIETGNESDLLDAVADGPVSVALRGVDSVLGFYAKGIFDRPCTKYDIIDHAMTVVGYGSENGKDYWIVRNSWGPEKGEDGYVRFARGKNLCGIADAAFYPVV